MIADGGRWFPERVEDVGERKQDAGREQGQDKDNGDDDREPRGRETGEEEEAELIACDGGPVDHGVQAAEEVLQRLVENRKEHEDDAGDSADEE